MERSFGLIFVLALHAAALWGLWQQRLIPVPAEATTTFVHFIAAPAPRKQEEPKQTPLPKPKPIEKPGQIVAVASAVVAPTDYVAPAPLPSPAPQPVSEAPVVPPPAGPVALATELAVACPNRPPPTYPAISRRLNEEGVVLLQVELDETGQVAAARLYKSSGFPRLDEAALSAVKTWRCNPAQRNGLPVKASALQAFKFVLQGN